MPRAILTPHLCGTRLLFFGDNFYPAFSGTTLAIPEKAAGRLKNGRARFSAADDVLGNGGTKHSVPEARLSPRRTQLESGRSLLRNDGQN